jgi:hypothetical protein
MENFNPNFTLQNEYYIEGVQFTDDGNFNDITSGDGIYTSIQTFPTKQRNVGLEKIKIITGADFEYYEELGVLLKEKKIDYSVENLDNKSIGCDFQTAVCPETSWWNTCWPMSSPCTCIEFYNCSVSIL